MIARTAVAPGLFACLAISLSAQAPGDPTPPTAKPLTAAAAPQTPKNQNLGDWWEKNAKKIKPFPTRWLFHGESTFSYMNASGNTSGSTLDLSASGEIRKDRFTNHLLAEYSRKDVSYGLGQGSINYTERTLREQLDFDPAEYITFFAAIEDYQNTMMYLDKRLLMYGGLGGRVFKNEKSELVLNGGLGYAEFAFDRSQLQSADPASLGTLDTSPSSGGAVATQTWRWKVSPRFSFNQDASYMKYFDPALGNRWTLNLSGKFPIRKGFSFHMAYRVQEETADIIKVLGVFPQDRTFLMGFSISH